MNLFYAAEAWDPQDPEDSRDCHTAPADESNMTRSHHMVEAPAKIWRARSHKVLAMEEEVRGRHLQERSSSDEPESAARLL